MERFQSGGNRPPASKEVLVELSGATTDDDSAAIGNTENVSEPEDSVPDMTAYRKGEELRQELGIDVDKFWNE